MPFRKHLFLTVATAGACFSCCAAAHDPNRDPAECALSTLVLRVRCCVQTCCTFSSSSWATFALSAPASTVSTSACLPRRSSSSAAARPRPTRERSCKRGVRADVGRHGVSRSPQSRKGQAPTTVHGEESARTRDGEKAERRTTAMIISRGCAPPDFLS
eukprot:6728555-Prymnesium_polylepis.1